MHRTDIKTYKAQFELRSAQAPQHPSAPVQDFFKENKCRKFQVFMLLITLCKKSEKFYALFFHKT